MSFIIKLSNDLYLAFDWRDVFRLCAFVAIAFTALLLGIVAGHLRHPARLLPWVWAWAVACASLFLLPFAAEWWFYRISAVFGILITARCLGMRIRRFEDAQMY